MSIAVDKMRPKLLQLPAVYERLETTEPLGTELLNNDSRISFLLDEDWTTELETAAPDEFVGALVRVNGRDYQLTKEAALQAGAAFGLTGAYVSKTPAKLVEPHLNYWYGTGMGTKAFNLLTQGDDRAYAFAKPTTTPFSNTRLLDQALSTLKDIGYDGEVLADYKFHHSLTETNIRLILPDYVTEVHGADLADVKSGLDTWSGGLQLTNSLVGKAMTSIDGYLFRWWCTNGATQQIAAAGPWNRKSQGQNVQLVLEWLEESVEEIFAGFDPAFDRVRALTQLDISRNLGDVLREVFDQHKVPVSQRQSIIDEMTLIEGPVTMYHLQAALTRTANEPGLSPARIDALLRIGGSLSSAVFDPIKAKIWREGNAAPKGTKSPYEIEGVE